MPDPINQMFRGLEQDTSAGDTILWPNTQLSRMQHRIREFQGVADTDGSPKSRPAQIIAFLEKQFGTTRFSILDLLCGDAIVLQMIANSLPCDAYGIDLQLRKIPSPSHYDNKLHLYQVSLQKLLPRNPPWRFDVAMMLNTYRDWPSSGLGQVDARKLKIATDEWMQKNASMSILTATDKQIAQMDNVEIFGTGEQGSELVAWRHT